MDVVYQSRFPQNKIKLNCYSGGVESNWVHSALRPLTGLLCQPRVIMMMEKLIKWLSGKPKYLEKTCPSATFVHHKIPHDQTRGWSRAAAVGSRRLTACAMARPVQAVFLFGLWGYWHCGHSWRILPASSDSEDDCGEADGMCICRGNLPQRHFCPLHPLESTYIKTNL
jgi:hypothetical protein